MAVVDSYNELLEEPACFALHQSTVISHIMALNIVNQVPSWCILADNAQVLWSKQHLVQLNNVGMHAAQSLIQDFFAR